MPRNVPVPLSVPDLGSVRSDIRVIQWLMDEASPVVPGDRIVELLADGVLFHVSCDVPGVLLRIECTRGADVATGETLAWIEPES